MNPCRLIPVLFVVIFLYSCNKPGTASHIRKESTTDTSKKIKTASKSKVALKPVFGYRFVVIGDFDGDGKKETLTEHFFSGIDHKETYKFYENGSYDTLVALNGKRKTYCFLSCSNKNIKPLTIATKQQLGIAYLKNEGDLDGDGTDEISYVVDCADWSNVNFCHILTYKNNQWKELYSFQIRDWQLPDLPQTYNQYGPMGLEDKIINTTDSSANKKIEQNLKDFKGLIRKMPDNKISVIRTTDDAVLDTTTIDLKKARRKRNNEAN